MLRDASDRLQILNAPRRQPPLDIVKEWAWEEVGFGKSDVICVNENDLSRFQNYKLSLRVKRSTN